VGSLLPVGRFAVELAILQLRRADVVENRAIALVDRRAEAGGASFHLLVEAEAAQRPDEDDAADVGSVEAGRQEVDGNRDPRPGRPHRRETAFHAGASRSVRVTRAA